ncbi:EAL domain-containing protein [Roseofilum sp. Guam]|uniref:EAL domain-containing protein n=1 Tax=Roseofilum sp. Guam TaxID=2821502 RepID=UPI001B2A848E|nr:EAL domain-containing protein [Roseofilum sp. Guam]MBP0031184.1 EAL domain-containing protein [Roseofilum sp. Guam]
MEDPLVQIQILLIEDNRAEARLLQERLKQAPSMEVELTHVSRLSEALNQLEEQVFKIILLDLSLPDAQGLESLNPLMEKVPDVPIIVLTNNTDSALAVEAVRQGAQDYLIKRQLNTELLTRSLRYAIERKQSSDALRKANETLEQRVIQRTTDLVQANLRLKQEISDRQNLEEALQQEKELAQITLNSIGDAVIVTNVNHQIESLNPVAEKLMGLSSYATQGRSVSEIFSNSDIKQKPIEILIHQCLATGKIVKVSNYALYFKSDRQHYIIELCIAPIRLKGNLLVGTVIVCRDVTSARNLAHQLSWQASHDPLTGLINRREFEQCLKAALEETHQLNQQHILCYLDLDQFKIVNDTCGHSAGDQLLRQITGILQSNIRKTDTFGRLGGDEFGLLLHYCSVNEGQKVAQKIIETIQSFRFVWEDKLFTIGVSIGLVPIDRSIENEHIALSAADTAMYAAKEGGRNRIHIYQIEDREVVKRQGDMQWVARINRALEENQFCLYIQQIVPLNSRSNTRPFGELFIRMIDGKGTLIPPMAFLPAAERYDLMPEIDRWVIRNLFKQLSEQIGQGSGVQYNRFLKPIYLVNLSGASFNDVSFLKFLKEQFWLYHIPPSLIGFEITETVAITHLNQAVRFITELKELGCQFALDDFGSGMSSFTYLKQLPIDYLKIDGAFIKSLIEDRVNRVMVESIQRIAQVMGLKTIAESIENEEILAEVKALGINYAQGYGIHKPHRFTLEKKLELMYRALPG